MKGQISRDSHRPARRYSGVYHIQGGMITDADLDERSDIVKARTDALGNDAVLDGVPAEGGAVDLSGATPALREGVIYADGVRGVLTAREGAEPSGPLDLVTMQADLLDGPEVTTGARVVYADIWERPVFALEDEYLADAGLHGAETAYRSRTMCQIKLAPETATADIEAGTGRYPQIGDATLEVAALDPEATIDECDPCADVVSAEQRIANILFRLEIVRVDGPANAPTRIDLAWSAENGAIIARSDIDSEAFERAGAVYELYSETTEGHMGAFANSNSMRNSLFVDDLDAPPATGSSEPYVRRWDGYARLDVGGGAVHSTLGTGFDITYDGTEAELSVDSFTATLSLGGNSVLRGDYWLIELRTFAEPNDRIRLVSELPVGILHHYCVLFRLNGGAALALTDAERRKLSFPPLSNLPATHVGFDNNCAKLYADAENVQDALDNLCDISADDIAFDPSRCPRLYDSADTVQEALDNLCKVDFSIENVLQLLFDWGVVCGLVVRLEKKGEAIVTISGGWFLDRAGRLANFKGGQVDVNDLFEKLSREEREIAAKLLSEGQLCLTVAADAGREVSLHLVPKEDAFGPPDPGLVEVVRACIETKGRVKVADGYLALKEQERAVIGKVALVAAQQSTLGGAQRLSQSDAVLAKSFSDQMADAYRKIASDDEIARLDALLAQLDADFEQDKSVGETREIRQMQYQAQRLAIVLINDQERAQRCLCEGMFPTCPPELGKPPFHVPIACLEGFVEGRVRLTRVCMVSCRKQAMTWRSANYVIKGWRDRLAENLAALCCPDEKDDDGQGFGFGKLAYDAGLETATLAEWFDRYKLIDGVLREEPTGQAVFEATPEVDGLTVEAAGEVMIGNGADIVETVKIDDTKAAELINKSATGITPIDQLSDKGAIRPGDKVVLLEQDGIARGYVVVERGAGKYVFTERPEAQIIGISPETAERIDAFATRLSTVTDAEVRIDSEIDRLAATRDGLDSDVERLSDEIESLTSERDKMQAELTQLAEEQKKTTDEINAARDKAQAELAALAEEQKKTTDEITAARRELDDAAAKRDEFVITIRRNQPIASLGMDAELARKLAGRGVLTIADITKTQLDKLVADKVITRAQANSVSRTATAFLQRKIE